MSNVLKNLKQQQQEPQSSAALAVKSPAIEGLQASLDAKGDELENEARQVTRRGMAKIKTRVLGAVAEEMSAIADDDDFFGFGSMFDSPVNQLQEEDPPADRVIDTTAKQLA